MSILVDLIIIAIIALFTFLGYKRGLIGVAFKMLSFVIAVVVAFILYKPVSSMIIHSTTWDESLTTSIQEIIKGNSEDTLNQEKIDNAPDAISSYINSVVEDATAEVKANIAETVSYNLAINIIQGGVLLALYIIARIVLFFLKTLSDMIADLPVVKQFNDLGGIIYGLLEGFLILFVVLGIVSLFFNNSVIQTAITTSYLGNFLYQNNILLMILF